MEKIRFQLEDGKEAEFYVEEQTRIGGTAYLLVWRMRQQPIFSKTYRMMKVRKPAMKWSRMRTNCRQCLKFLNRC